MNHYYKIALACFTVLFAVTPAMAKDAGNCGANSSQVKPSEMHDCLARMNDPSRVKERQQQEKRDRCEQNAKNRKLEGGAKANFISSCMNENEAAAAHASVTQGRPAAASGEKAKKAASAGKKKRAANSCVTQANKQHLKGQKRREFLKGCKPE
jgi:psiF repeat